MNAARAFGYSPSARGAGAPLLPQRGVCEQLDVDAADDRARLKADLLAIAGAEPVRERDAARRLVDEAVDGGDEGLEILVPFGERRRPDDPVELGVSLSVVERKAVPVLLRPVEGYLPARDRRRKEVQAQQ